MIKYLREESEVTFERLGKREFDLRKKKYLNSDKYLNSCKVVRYYQTILSYITFKVLIH